MSPYPDPRRSFWSSSLKFLYLWSLLAAVFWAPLYSSYDGEFIFPVHAIDGDGSLFQAGNDTEMETFSSLTVGGVYECRYESRRYRVHIRYEVARETEEGFRIQSAYTFEPKHPSQEAEIWIIRSYPTGVQKDSFFVNRRGRPIEETYSSGCWTLHLDPSEPPLENSEREEKSASCSTPPSSPSPINRQRPLAASGNSFPHFSPPPQK
jgi:hypothetical protein